MKIGNNIKMFREIQDITQSDLASKVGISKNALSKIERYESVPSLDTAMRICLVLDVDFDSLFGFYDEENGIIIHMEDLKNYERSI